MKMMRVSSTQLSPPHHTFKQSDFRLQRSLCALAAYCLAFAIVVMHSGCGSDSDNDLNNTKVDDWVFVPSADKSDAANVQYNSAAPTTAGGVSFAADESLGYAVGGANGIDNFRENIENGYLPLSTDITYEGLFYEYTFDTGQRQPCEQLFCPSYTQMLSSDPLSTTKERFISVGLNSNLSAESFSRKKLNLVVVLDISGSMGSSFSAYYYDGNDQIDEAKSKMALANESLVSMLAHLTDADRFGMVLFESEAALAKPLTKVGQTDMEAIKAHILEITEHGGTNMEAGYKKGIQLFEQLANADPAEYENRIIFMTDAMPNTGDTSENSLFGMVESNAQKRIFTTFIGIGVDFNTALVESITKVEGANYYAVHNAEEFKTRMDDEFEFMVTPLVFDLKLAFSSDAFAIDEVYGSPEADQATGVLMQVNTLFPSKVEAGETKGGVVLLKLSQTNEGSEIDLTATYEDRAGQPFSTNTSFAFDATLGEAPNTGIRKAALLSRYVRLMKDWINSERAQLADQSDSDTDLGQWERQSVPLTVSSAYKEKMQTFLDYMQTEIQALNDDELNQEVAILQKLIAL